MKVIIHSFLTITYCSPLFLLYSLFRGAQKHTNKCLLANFLDDLNSELQLSMTESKSFTSGAPLSGDTCLAGLVKASFILK